MGVLDALCSVFLYRCSMAGETVLRRKLRREQWRHVSLLGTPSLQVSPCCVTIIEICLKGIELETFEL